MSDVKRCDWCKKDIPRGVNYTEIVQLIWHGVVQAHDRGKRRDMCKACTKKRLEL